MLLLSRSFCLYFVYIFLTYILFILLVFIYFFVEHIHTDGTTPVLLSMSYTVIDLQNDSLPSAYELYKIEYNGDSDNERKVLI